MRKVLTISLFGVGVAVIAFLWLAHRESTLIRQDVERSRKALEKVSSFHFHYDGPNFLAGQPPLMEDVWVLCPNYRYAITRVAGSADKEEIHFQGSDFQKVSEWVKVPRGTPIAAVQGCGTLADDYGLGIPAGFDLMLNYGEIHVDNHPRTVGGEACYDYTATIGTADVAKRQIVQKLCLNSDDHLPREVRFRGWGSDRDSVYTYDEWNKMDHPNFPEGFHPDGY